MTNLSRSRTLDTTELPGLEGALADVERGGTVVLTRDGRPVALIVPPDAARAVGLSASGTVARESGATYSAGGALAGSQPPTALVRLIGTSAARSVLGLFVQEPARALHQREIARRAGVGLRSAQLALERLGSLGLVASERDGNRRYYRAIRTERFEALRGLLGREFGMVGIIARALADLSDRVEWAFIFGSAARGEDQVGSDVDLCVIGDVSGDDLVAPIAQAQRELGREIDVHVYRPREFAEKRAADSHFVTALLAGPRVDVVGGPDDV